MLVNMLHEGPATHGCMRIVRADILLARGCRITAVPASIQQPDVPPATTIARRRATLMPTRLHHIMLLIYRGLEITGQFPERNKRGPKSPRSQRQTSPKGMSVLSRPFSTKIFFQVQSIRSANGGFLVSEDVKLPFPIADAICGQ